ncbi:hypothetical protein [Echinicola rosea]|uniref:Uncharacterized protein n=1 Tax=Echinicola rosea TaxID=1807691 RepID=A0ABQ1VA57_9BACT|nr:hypothetical protein [Echinicola rosea]GGF46161.1 hypothetical protein GCM10011339_38320 [Echinicola rosea]
MHFYKPEELLKKIDRNGQGAIISRGVATAVIGIFMFATAVTLDLRLLLISIFCLSVCWFLEAYFNVNEVKHQQLFDLNNSDFQGDSPKAIAKNWFGQLFLSLNGLFYFLAIIFHGAIFILVQ